MEKQHLNILMVEDDSDDVCIVRDLLGDRWDGSFQLDHVELLKDGLTRLGAGSFDAVLLDLNLPDSTGLDTLSALFADAGDVPVVVLTGHNDEETAMKAVQAGAQDYLVKGLVDGHSLVRSIRYAIERSRRQRAEEAMREATKEFRVAGEIQQRLFPLESPKLDGFDIAGAVYPATATAGDYFDYIPMLNDCVGIVVGDVSGHGMGPALLMSETRACLRTLTQSYFDVGDILTRANRLLAADTDDFHFVTLAMARLDPLTHTLVYAGAGQRGYLLDDEDVTVTLDSTSAPLGVWADTIVPTAPPRVLESGEIVTLFTDGVAEAESPDKVRFGVARALEIIRTERNRPAATIVAKIHRQITDFCRNQPQRDDITIVVVKVE